MPAFIVGFAEEMAPEPMIAYREGMEATLAPYGGRYRTTIRHRWETLEGTWPSQYGAVILEFPSYKQATGWYHSAAYAPLRDIRMAGDRWHIIVMDGMAEGDTLQSIGILTPEERARMAQPTAGRCMPRTPAARSRPGLPGWRRHGGQSSISGGPSFQHTDASPTELLRVVGVDIACGAGIVDDRGRIPPAAESAAAADVVLEADDAGMQGRHRFGSSLRRVTRRMMMSRFTCAGTTRPQVGQVSGRFGCCRSWRPSSSSRTTVHVVGAHKWHAGHPFGRRSSSRTMRASVDRITVVHPGDSQTR